jgi:cobalt-zinc-cadmium efflux system outer membrane protein
LPLWNRNAGAILSAQAARDQAGEQLAKVRIHAAADVTSARVAYSEAAARAQRYQGSLLPKSATVVASVKYAYQKGGASLVDLLEAERNDNLVRVSAAQAQADAASAAVTLRAALGRLDESSSPTVPAPP